MRRVFKYLFYAIRTVVWIIVLLVAIAVTQDCLDRIR